MKPIIGLVVVAVAGLTLGSGFLSNDIELWVQQFGVGETIITSPVEHATVDFVIFKTEIGNFFKNIVSECVIQTDTVGTTNPETPGKMSEVICKLTNENAQIIAEGKVVATNFPTGTPIVIPIEQGFADVQDVHDVKIVVHANTYS